jgi:hypothetical protein
MSQELSVIIGAVVGALAAILGSAIPTLITARAERVAAEKERQERRENEIIRLQEKWIERDVEKVEAAADAVSIAMREIHHLGEMQQALKMMEQSKAVTEEESKAKLNQVGDELAQASKEMRYALARGSRSAFSLGPKIRAAFMDFDGVVSRLHRAMLGINQENQSELWLELVERGGALQEALRDHVVAVRQRGHITSEQRVR